MGPDEGTTYERALAVATRYFERGGDPSTRRFRDELAQDAAIEAWRRAPSLLRQRNLPPYTRTIARRLYARELDRDRGSVRVADLDTLPGPARDDAKVLVDGVWHDKREALAALDAAVDRLEALNARLVRGYYDGFSCRELATRYGLAEDAVKARLFRSRARLRETLRRTLRTSTVEPRA